MIRRRRGRRAIFATAGLALALILLASRTAAAPPTAGPMPPILAGAAVRTITPAVGGEASPVGMAGFSIGRVAEGVRDELQARALVLEAGAGTVAIVTLDLHGLARADVLRIREAVRSRPEAPRFAGILVAATRNHAGADATGQFAAAGLAVDRAWIDRMVRAAADAIDAAWRDRRPARLSFVTVRLPRLIADTRQPTRLDDRASLIRIESAAGRNGIAVIAGFAATPESLGRKSRLLSADYPGEVRRALEESFGGVGLFLTGASGGRMTPVPPPESAGGDPTAEIGRAIARALQVAWSGREEAREPAPGDLTQGEITWRSTTVRIPAGPTHGTGPAAGGAAPVGMAASGAARDVVDPDGIRTTEVGILEIRSTAGPILQVACIPGSPYPELLLGGLPDPQDPATDLPGAQRERPLTEVLDAPMRLLAGTCGDDLGEIIPASEWDERPPFAYGLKSPQRGEETSPGPGTAALLLKALQGLLR